MVIYDDNYEPIFDDGGGYGTGVDYSNPNNYSQQPVDYYPPGLLTDPSLIAPSASGPSYQASPTGFQSLGNYSNNLDDFGAVAPNFLQHQGL
jgi:hypothetical protein